MQIGSSNDSEAVKAQYATSKGLDTRLSFHDKYSTNKLGYGNWIVSNYEIAEAMKVLELGCGTGSLWMGRDELVDKFGKFVLTDFSEGMLATAKGNLGERKNLEYKQADIQDLPFEDDSFDVVIANSMLYHVPDIMKGISEVRRVLKDDGVFYTATLGENNFTDILAKWFELGGESFNPNHNFTMKNGGDMLKKAFADVEGRIYGDSLHVTDIEDLVDYLCSLASFKTIMDIPVDRIAWILKEHAVDGAIDLPKEYGMFIAKGVRNFGGRV
ncbi:class I SAM-dependent methyltransferase [Butyrivibrio sp. LC3010]|uniref:class I SAM-dependent methyltransferase n=1 Tax=Butyrivibrio sp. LC3010 TaxID=1280680 RepID=UPI000413177E|nr:class I SAM-dependent methyltransferase [Butyrivibrio sp. LC3010]